MATKTEKIAKPKFGGGLMSDLARSQQGGKVDVIGIFTRFNAWSLPCSRNWFLAFTLFDAPKNGTVLIGIKKQGRPLKSIGILDFESRGKGQNQVIQTPLAFEFEKEGMYEIVCELKNSKATLKIPFQIDLLPWPEFTKEEIDFARKLNNKGLTRVNAQINCPSCNHLYIFEESIFEDEEPSGGTYRFPENEEFECVNCSNSINLKDIQGQIRSTIKDNIVRLMKSSNV